MGWGKCIIGEILQWGKFYNEGNFFFGSCMYKILKIEMFFLVYFGMLYILFDY